MSAPLAAPGAPPSAAATSPPPLPGLGTGAARRPAPRGKTLAAVPARTSASGRRARRAAGAMDEPEMQLKGKKVTDKFTESVYVLANEPSVALYRLQEHVRRSLPELAQHKADMQRWEEQSQGAVYTVEYACRADPVSCHSAVKNLVDSSVHFRSVEGLLKQAISIREHMNTSAHGHR
ncbi:BLOC-1-related complex subunit 8 isoform X3 [Sorex araneus]|uniref:BLOC-1-related complex subunit 8 isoform X3 n=1 Tax=Sorex araneus TaxID=42254 RepID=UPI0024338B4B|nr:BLOC-1-related complex subunit 8 isoform X3 [Sorex araneus]